MTKRGLKRISRIRSGGVTVSKKRLEKEARDPAAASLLVKKLRTGGLPTRKAAAMKRR